MKVTFDEDQQPMRQPPQTRSQSRLLAFLLKKKLVKSEQQGYMVLLGVVVLCIVCSIFFLRSSLTETDIDDKYYYDPFTDGG